MLVHFNSKVQPASVFVLIWLQLARRHFGVEAGEAGLPENVLYYSFCKSSFGLAQNIDGWMGMFGGYPQVREPGGTHEDIHRHEEQALAGWRLAGL